MKNTPNFKLLKDAYAIIGGIPAKAIDLNDIQLETGESLSCGTICCAAGWLGHHPQFQALGFVTTESGYTFYKRRSVPWHEAMAKVFNISESAAIDIFNARRHSDLHQVEDGLGTDKQVWLRRMRNFLRKHGQLKSQLAAKQRKELS
jgi:hypothetical protein